jgi:hypothetical protein
MTDFEPHGVERRLANSRQLGRLLRDANREYAEPVNEAAAFRRLSERLAQSNTRLPGFWLLAPVAALLLVALVVLPRLRSSTPTEPLAAAEPPRPAFGPKPLSGTETRMDRGSRALTAGVNRLSDGSTASLLADSSGGVQEAREATRVTLSKGSIELRVVEQSHGRRFEVAADDYRFQVLGTVFKLQLAENGVKLEVREGLVGVWKGEALLASVSAGEHWDSLDAAEVAPSSAASAAAATTRSVSNTEKASGAAEPGPDCLNLARQGETRDAEQCFLQRAAGAGLGAEMALYEVARLRRDVLRDPGGALQALDEYRQRFPSGSLRREADMSYLELLVQLGRSLEALDQSNTLLASGSGRERVAELRLLRGDIFRRNLNDIPSAEREYALAEQLTGAAGAEATYLRGVCLEALGNTQAAAEAFERYLQRSPRPRSDEAQRRLDALRARP